MLLFLLQNMTFAVRPSDLWARQQCLRVIGRATTGYVHTSKCKHFDLAQCQNIQFKLVCDLYREAAGHKE